MRSLNSKPLINAILPLKDVIAVLNLAIRKSFFDGTGINYGSKTSLGNHLLFNNLKEVFMVVRLTYCKFNPDSINEAKAIYNRDIVPVVKMQKGNLGIRLMEPVEKSDDFVSISEWATQADAGNYERSGVYKSLVAKVAGFLTRQPILKTYIAEGVLDVH